MDISEEWIREVKRLFFQESFLVLLNKTSGRKTGIINKLPIFGGSNKQQRYGKF